MARLSDSERFLRAITESTVQETIRDAASVLGALYFHDQDSRRNPSGWPDVALTIPGSGVLWLLELKTETGRLKPEQMAWGLSLLGCDRIRYEVVRPSNLTEIITEIARGRNG